MFHKFLCLPIFAALIASSLQAITEDDEKFYEKITYFLADSCYDVWMGNNRGNALSHKHESLSTDPNSEKYWNFTYDEMGRFDVPTFIELIQLETGQPKVHYIGHSSCSTEFFVYCSLSPEACQRNVISSQHFGPAVYLNSTKGLFKSFIELNGGLEYNPRDGLLNLIFRILATLDLLPILALILNGIGGPDGGESLSKLLKLNVNYFPAGSSTGLAKHFLQNIYSGEFRRYDNGRTRNLELYGTEVPPEYPIQDIPVPMHLHYGLNEYIVRPEGVFRLLKVLQFGELHPVPYDKWNHFDFTFGKHAIEFVYTTVLEILNRN